MTGRRRSGAVLSEATATFQVSFLPRPQSPASVAPRKSSGWLPRATRLLALAHRIDGMIRDGEIRDWAEAARLAGVTRARITQIMNLLLLAPEIQEAILSLPRDGGITERHLRPIAALVEWQRQQEVCQSLCSTLAPDPPGQPRFDRHAV